MEKEMLLPSWLAELRYLTLSFRYFIDRDIKIDLFLGPEVRGSVGRQLKEFQGCYGNRDIDCQQCSDQRRQDCPYYYCFEHGGNRRKAFSLKLDPAFRGQQQRFERGDTFRFDLVLAGPAIKFALPILKALRNTQLCLGELGFSPKFMNCGWLDEKKSFVSSLQDHQCAADRQQNFTFPVSGYSFCYQENLVVSCGTIHFLTPAEITLKHGQVLKDPQHLNFRLLMVRIVQGLRGLLDENLVAEIMPKSVDKQREEMFFTAAEKISLMSDKVHWQRVRLRQPGKRFCGGLSGMIVCQGNLKPFFPFLEAVSLFGLGKSTTFGLGHIALE